MTEEWIISVRVHLYTVYVSVHLYTLELIKTSHKPIQIGFRSFGPFIFVLKGLANSIHSRKLTLNKLDIRFLIAANGLFSLCRLSW